MRRGCSRGRHPAVLPTAAGHPGGVRRDRDENTTPPCGEDPAEPADAGSAGMACRELRLDRPGGHRQHRAGHLDQHHPVLAVAHLLGRDVHRTLGELHWRQQPGSRHLVPVLGLRRQAVLDVHGRVLRRPVRERAEPARDARPRHDQRQRPDEPLDLVSRDRAQPHELSRAATPPPA